ncbi:MAG: SIMPL domain-containing protein [Chloroflexi bacterium]|nr:SIMPL domain-containing protein [Chloroflexota bacterium]
MEQKPDTIKISVSQREELFASYANLFVTVRGSSVFSGDQAMKKAKEVSQLVDELIRFGLKAEDIHLQGVHVENNSGGLLKSSSAAYRLKVRCEKLDQIADVLDIVTSQKNATLERIEWKYADEEAHERGLEAAITKAKAKAEKVAVAMGVNLLGVYDFLENTYDEEAPIPFQMQAQAVRAKSFVAAVEQGPSLGMDIQHSKVIHINVDVWYRVSAFL